MKYPINVGSEIGKLKVILVHRPGRELENLTPNTLKRLLFDDIPYLLKAQREHDYFTNVMRKYGVDVLYVEQLAAETLNNVSSEIRSNFIQQFIQEAKVKLKYQKVLRQYLSQLDHQTLINTIISGVANKQLILDEQELFFICEPLPNVLFQRDPITTIGNGMTINRMWTLTRNRESIIHELIFNYHPHYKNKITFYYQRYVPFSIEGGDILILNSKNLIVGYSQRTSIEAIKVLSQNIINDIENKYERVIVLEIPKQRAFMHLDTVFTNIDYNKFLVHPLIFDYLDQFKIWEITNRKIKAISLSLKQYLANIIGEEVEFIACGGDDEIAASREQWNDGTNVLVLEPGVVIAYERNYVTIATLKKHNIKVITIPSSELSRGRGGPRCMTMPLVRENIKKVARDNG